MIKGKKIELSDRLSIIAIIVSFLSLFVTTYIYFNTTQPHTEFDELKERLSALDNKIERTEKRIKSLDNESSNISYLSDKLFDIKIARDNAWKNWNNYEFNEANKNISQAHVYINDIDIYLYEEDYTVPILIIIAMIIVVIMIMGILKSKKPRK